MLLLRIGGILRATLRKIWLTRMGKIEVEDFPFELFRIFILVQEVCLALSFTIDGDDHVG